GTTLGVADITAWLLANAATDGDDNIDGTPGSDTLGGGKGDDLVAGEGANDVYLYARGDGDDRIDALTGGQDLVRLVDLNVSDIATAVRAGAESNDLVVTFKSSGDRLLLRDALSAANSGGTTLALQFADGTLWDRDAMRARALQDIVTSGNDAIYGFEGADSLHSGAGDDLMSGGAGNDSYSFARGDGHDTVLDAATGTNTDV
ncbi:hypothetical protein LTR94_030736, partial [Friedmanniomyces endolithicus]